MMEKRVSHQGANSIFIHSVINHNRVCHSRESGNPGKYWIPGQARNDKPYKTYVVMYIDRKGNEGCYLREK